MFPYAPFTTFRFPIVFNPTPNQQSCPLIIPNGIIPINFPLQNQNLQLNSSKQTPNVANVKPDEGKKVQNSKVKEKEENKTKLKPRQKQLQNNNKKKESLTELSTPINRKKSKIYMTEKAIYRNKKLEKEIISVRKNQKMKTRKFIQKQINKEQKFEKVQKKLKVNVLSNYMKKKNKIQKENQNLIEGEFENGLVIPEIQIGSKKFQARLFDLKNSLMSRKFE